MDNNKITIPMPEFTKEKLAHCEGSTGPCERTDAEWVLRGTMYQDERSNWAYLCPDCARDEHNYWHDMWQDYWESVL